MRSIQFCNYIHFCASVAFKESAAYWVGASDEIFEGDFRWSNGFPYTYSSMYLILHAERLLFNTLYFSFFNNLDWFPGWMEHNNYNKQPNDDGENQFKIIVELFTIRVIQIVSILKIQISL